MISMFLFAAVMMMRKIWLTIVLAEKSNGGPLYIVKGMVLVGAEILQ